MVSTNRLRRWHRQITEQLEHNTPYALDVAERYFQQVRDDRVLLLPCITQAAKLARFKLVEAWAQILSTIDYNGLSATAMRDILVAYSSCVMKREAIEHIQHCIPTLKDYGLLLEFSKVALGFGDSHLSHRLAELALSIQRNSNTLTQLGTSKQYLGDIEGAKQLFFESISLGGGIGFDRYMLASCAKWSQKDNHIAELLTDINGYQPGQKPYSVLAGALAKEYEDLGDFDNAFTWLKNAGDSERLQVNYNANNDKKIIEIIDRVSDAIAANPQPLPYKPVFILGLPRTGSTLLERIISSHSKVSSIGESQAIRAALRHTLSTHYLSEKIWQAILDGNVDLALDKVSELYLKYSDTDISEPYIIDKTPQNIYYLGLILKIFPEAKIIYTDRNPMDSCLSNYKQIFGVHSFPYSYDLLEIAQQYMLVNRYADKYRQQFPQRVYWASYEELVTSPESEVPKIIEFLDLEMEDRCLHPDKKLGAITTASFYQARSAINTNSLYKWKKFDSKLQPLKDFFLSNGVVID